MRPCILLLLACSFAIISLGQDNTYGKVSISSPTAASLGKYADIPVNYHTGIPQINIPIYEVKEGPLNLPIVINYHASGLKVMEQCSWVGSGWSLNAGGVITRTIQGTPDEKHTGVVDNDYGHFSDYGYNSYFQTGIYSGTETGFKFGLKDGEPDLFFFNFGKYSGKFYFNDDRTPIFLPQQDFKLQYKYTGSGSIQSFILTTPDGISYYFGKTAETTDIDPVETSYSYTTANGASFGSSISSWYLNKVQSPDSLFSIRLDYASDSSSYYIYSSSTLDGTDTLTRQYDLVKNFINGVRLSKISFSNGVVNFIPGAARQDVSGFNWPLDTTEVTNTHSKTLGAISITDSGTVCRKYYFSYDYFQDNTALTGYFSTAGFQSDRKRLKLLKVQEATCDSSVLLPAHEFEYFTGTVPRKLSLAQDHWGYYNGASNSRLMPTLTFDHLYVKYFGADRESKWPEIRNGSLKKITYPTGGSTEFEFEPNRAWISYPAWQRAYVDYRSAGFDGNQSTQYFNITFSESNHILKIVNSSGGGNGYVSTPGGTFSATPGQTIEHTATFSPGTYSIGIQKSGATTGNGVEVYFFDIDSVQVQKNDTVGGMRIKSTIVYDGISTQNNIVTNYNYELPNGRSSGILYSRPTYMQILKNDVYRDAASFCIDNNGNGCDTHSPGYYCPCSIGGQPHTNGVIGLNQDWNYFKSASTVRPMHTTQGNIIGYNQVKVSKTGQGYSMYQYYGSDTWDTDSSDVAVRNITDIRYCRPGIPDFPNGPLPFEFKRGELKKEEHFNQAGQLLKSSDYSLTFATSNIITRGLIALPIPITGSSSHMVKRYKMSTQYKTQSTISTKEFVAGIGYLQDSITMFYESPYHRQVTRQRKIDSNGDTLEIKFKYAFDYRASPCDTISDCHSTYSGNDAYCEGEWQQSLSTCSDQGCRYDAWQDLKICISNYRMAYITCRRTKFTDSSNSYNTCFQSAKSAANTDLKPILELQSRYVNALIEQTDWKNNYLKDAEFNKYSFTITNNPFLSNKQTIYLSGLSTTFTPSAVNGTGLTKDSRYETQIYLVVENGNVTEYQKGDDYKMKYIWDYKNNHPIAICANSDNQAVSYTSFEADGKGGWSFSGSTSIHPLAPTGQRSYALSGGNITRSGLAGSAYIVTYWKRDSAGTVTINSGSGTSVVTRNGWILYRHVISGASTLTISGTALIDELRLYPSAAQMKTYTYSPLLGITTECDENNRITYYDYDSFGRLRRTKDQDKNVVKITDYQLNQSQNQ